MTEPSLSRQATKKSTWLEIAVVFAMSLGASAVYSVVSLVAALTAPKGLSGSSQSLNPTLASREWLDFSYQLLGLVFGVAPVALALYLLWISGRSPFSDIGLNLKRLGWSTNRGLILAACIGIPGLGLYVSARLLGLSAKIIPADLGGYWWTIPILLLAALRAALLEEVLVIAYLFDRLERIGFSFRSQLLISAALRASYHLYQGFGGFVGNLVMGLVFGWAYKRWGRVMPLVIAHFILDAVSFVGYATLSHLVQLP
jgi:membrane protease YdiL (CAAX protease family)